jgi:hypothetical protein
MGKKRDSLGFDDTIDLEELTVKLTPPKQIDKAKLNKIAEQTGFINRQPRKKRSRTKYTAQINIKIREGIKQLFQEMGTHLETFDNETFELAMLALIEKSGTKEQLNRLKELLE